MAQTAEMAPSTDEEKPPPPSSKQRRPRFNSSPYLLIVPTAFILAVVLLWPMLQMFWYSFTDYTLTDLFTGESPEWNNFANYRELLTDPVFWTIFRNTIIVCGSMVVLTMVLGTLIGLLLHKLPRWFATVVATAMMLAWATPAMSASLVFRWLFMPDRGLVGYVLDALPDWLVGSGWQTYNWFLDPLPVFSILILIIVWQGFPFIAVSVLAGLKSVPNELYEAARIDGAGPWQSFWKVTLPMLRPLFSLLLVLQIIWDFRVFTQLYILANGFQNRDLFLLSYYIYQQGFSASPPDYGMGSAIAVTMTVIIMAVTVYYIRIMSRQGETR